MGRIKVMSVIVLTSVVLSYGAGHRCGTSEAIREFYSKGPMSPPDLPLWIGTEHFKIWYDTAGYHAVYPGDDDSDGVPDYPESVGVYLENVWHILVDSLGYREPLPDTLWAGDSIDYGGDPRIDVYIANVGVGFYGETVPRVANRDGVSLKATSYLEIQSDMTRVAGEGENPYPLLKVTCAHELFHSVQFAYRFPELAEYPQFVWWMEASAVFDEEFCYDEVNDYYNYLPAFQDAPEVPLFTPNYNGSIEYGAVLFPIFLEEYFAPAGVRFTGQCVKRIWELCETNPPVSAAELFCSERGTSLGEIYAVFSDWRFRTGEHWRPGYFHEGANYPLPACDSIDFSSEDNFWQDLTVKPLATRYFLVPYTADSCGILAKLRLWTDFSSASLGISTVGLISADSLDSFNTYPPESFGGVAGLWRYRAVGIYPLVYSAPSEASVSVLVEKSDSLAVPMRAENEIYPPFPNPARPGLPISFACEILSPGRLTVQIFSADGEIIWESSHDFSLPQYAVVEWDGRTKTGESVAPGIYIYRVELTGQTKTGSIFMVE